MEETKKLRNTWIRNHVLAYAIGLALLHPVIAHGFTGDHDVALSTPQFIMHTVSLFVFVIILVFFRNTSFRPQTSVNTFTGLLPALVFIPSFFWLGYYTLYIPFDIFFSFMCIGFLNGWSLAPYVKDKKLWMRTSVLAAFCGALAGIVAGIGSYFLFIKNMNGLAADFTIWSLISIPASLVSSLITARVLGHQLPSGDHI